MVRKKSNQKKIVRTKKPKPLVHNTESERSMRTNEWLKKVETDETSSVNFIDENAVLENFDKVPNSTDSLAVLKKISQKEIKEGIYYLCEWKRCRKEFETDIDLYNHVTSHILELKPFQDSYHCLWDLCDFEIQCNSEITRHIYYHVYHTKLKTIGESLSQLANIPRCTNDSKNRNLIPELKNDFICRWNNCKRTFLSIILYCQHVKNHCISSYEIMKSKKIRNFKIPCEWENCNMKFTVNYRLIEHIRKHTTERVVGCYHCGVIFKTNTLFLDHCKRQLANNTHEYQCAQCFKCFASDRLLRCHVVTHVNSFKCPLCDMTCNSTYGLGRHIRYRHLSVRPSRCTECDKRFVNKSDLEQHIQTIHKKKIFECGDPECNYVSKSLTSVKRHYTEIHANNKIIYACHWCDNRYKHGTKLSKHLINVHKFKLPSGHQRFMYRMHEDGVYRIQLMRFETLEVTKQILSPRESRIEDHCLEDSCSEMSESKSVQINAIHDDNSTDKFVVKYIEIKNNN